MKSSTSKQPANKFLLYFNLAVLAAYFHALMEWLFFVTQSSSLSTLSVIEKGKVLFVTGGSLAFLALILVLVFAIPARKWTSLGYVPAALLVSITVLVMLDNFSYTVFKFGVVTTVGVWRAVYIPVLIAIFYWTFRWVQRQRLWKNASYLTLSLLAISTVGILSIYLSQPHYTTASADSPSDSSTQRPNILILGSDGLSVSYLSAYGYREDTTPFISEMIKTSLSAENAFPNASSTTASTTSAMTGKEAAEVKVYRYPDILTKEDSFEHLPGILKHLGYQTVELGATYYVDANKVNLQDGFETVNNVSTANPVMDMIQPVLGNSSSAYFVETVAERASDRLLHIFFVKEMQNPFKQVNDPQARMTDDERTAQIINLLETSDRPVFVFSHFMNTHGPHFSSEHKGSATGESTSTNEAEWDVQQYKEAIRSFDAHVKEIYTYLQESGKLDNTIIVIYTDHGYRYVVNSRIPVIMHFPNDEHAGTRKSNIQIIDIPATILDYIGVDKPEWMMGSSFLNEEPSPTREIISITAGSPKKILPPFYQIKSIQVLVCQEWYVLNVQENTWKTGEVRGHTAKCDPSLLPADDVARQDMLNYLEKYGYDISSLK